jgi:riboflavin kinase/FMN adenylyltransferase
LSGRIVHGNSIGRTLGFPTANVEVKEEYKLLPKNGVYLINLL